MRTPYVPRTRVLHIEDDAFVAALVAATLEDAGIGVQWSSTGSSALTAAAACSFDAYLLGVGPRDMSRVLLAEELARLDPRAPLIVIADCRNDLRDCVDLTVVTAPFAPRALAGALQEALSAYCEAA